MGTSNSGVAFARYNADGSLDASFGTGGLRRHRATFFVAGGVRQPDGRIVVLQIRGSFGYALSRYAADGSLDATFDPSAAVAASTDAYTGYGARLAIDADGKILVASNINATLRLHRFLPNGALDSTFGTGGHVDTGVSFQGPTDILVQPDARVVLVYYDTTYATLNARRLMPDGSPDPSFTVATAPSGKGRTALLQPDGKIVVGGCSPASQYGGDEPVVVRWNADGSPDATFGGTGSVRPLPGEALCVQKLALRPDGRIAMSVVHAFNIPSARFGAFQLGATGAPDATFGTAGRVDFAMTTSDRDFANDVLVQADGTLVLGGSGYFDFGLARLTTSGALDAAFGTGGKVLTEFMAGSGGAVPVAVRADQDRYVVLAALSNQTIFAPVPDEVGLARLLADGSMDPTFGSGGQTSATLGRQVSVPVLSGQIARARALAVQADHKPLVAGIGILPGDVPNGVVMRFMADGSVDAGFGDTGRRAIVPKAVPDAVAVLADGRIVVAGRIPGTFDGSITPYENFVARLLPGGSLDATFGSGGVARFATDGDVYDQDAQHMTIRELAGGKLLVTGLRWKGLGAMRLLADGALDPGFATGGAFNFVLPGVPPPGQLLSRSAAVHADGRITVAGTAHAGSICASLKSQSAFARVDANGNAAASVPGAGLTAGLFAPDAGVEAIGLDPQDRIIAGGSRHNACVPSEMPLLTVSERVPTVVRFAPNGALDTRFGTNGIVTLGGKGSVADVLVGADGRTLALAPATSVDASFTLHALLGGGDSAPLGTAQDADNDGMPNAVELAYWRDAFVPDNDVFGNAQLFAMQQYRDFLAREGDVFGIAGWTNQVTSGAMTRGQVIESFFGSAEFQGTVAPVTRLYFAYFLRVPDYAGLTFWIDYYKSSTLEGISSQFAGSGEFQSTYGSLDNGQFVDLVYQNVLGRAADPGGRAHWKGQLDSNAMSRGQVMLGFSESPEYRTSSDSMIYVTMMYVGMLRRAPDQTGFDFWVGYRNAGNSGLALINAFLGSQEYRARFLP